MARVNIKPNGKIDGYLTVTECGKKIKESAAAVRKHIRNGELPAIKLYNMWLIKEKDLKKLK